MTSVLDRQNAPLLRCADVETRVFLIRHGVTEWHSQGRVLGHRDIGLNAVGLEQARIAAEALHKIPIADVLSSPLTRALQTAELISAKHKMELARDPRLTDLGVGKWEGMTYQEVAEHSEYKEFISDPLSERIPGAEALHDVRTRAVAAIEQALEDNPSGEAIAVVTHAGIIRVLLTHYLGSPPANYHRIRVAPGSISVLSFRDGHELPRVLAVNWTPALAGVLVR